MTFGTIQNTPEKYDMWAWSADSPMPCWFTLFALFTAETPSNQKLVLKKKKKKERELSTLSMAESAKNT